MRYVVAIALTFPISLVAVLIAALTVPESGSGVTGTALFLGLWAVLAVLAARGHRISRVIGRASLALGIAAIVLPFAVWWAVFGSGETAEGLEAIGIGVAGGIFLGMAIAVGAGVSIAALLLALVLLRPRRA